MPNLLDSSESDGEKKDGDHKMKLTSPSPAPSEPCFSLKSTTSQATQGPPKPPRDPSRVSSLDIRRNLPTTFAMKNVAGSTTSLPAFVRSRTLTNSITPKDTEFIWKAPPAPFLNPICMKIRLLSQIRIPEEPLLLKHQQMWYLRNEFY